MRILILTNLFPPHILGGYEIACCNVAAALRERGHDVEVLASHAPIATPNDPPYLHRVLALHGFDTVGSHTRELADARTYEATTSQYVNTATVLAHLRRFRPDLVYVWYTFGIGGLALLDLIEQVGVPWVMHLMDCVPAHLLGGVVPSAAALFARQDWAILTRARVIAMSQQVISEVAERTGIRFDIPPEIVPGWVDASCLSRRTCYSDPGHLRFVTAGSLGVHKGTDLIIDASAQLLREGHKAFSVAIYGIGVPEPWVAMAAQRGVGERIRWLSSVTQGELLAMLPDYDAFLFPVQSREPFGFAPLEAAACGLVPIITRTAGVAERMVDGVHTLKIDRTSDSLAGAMRQLLTGDVDVAAIGRRAARLVRSSLSFSRCLEDIERVLRGAARAWEPRRLDDPRLPAILFAKHALGQHLTAHP